MLHLTGILTDSVFIEDCLDAVAIESSLPAGPAIAVEHGLTEIFVIPAFIQLDHPRISGSAGRRMKIMLHAVSHNIVGYSIHLIANPFVRVSATVAKVIIENVTRSIAIRMVVILSGFHIGLVVPASVAVIIRGSCLSRSHPSGRRAFNHISGNGQFHVLCRHDEAVGIILRIIGDLAVVTGIIVVMVDRAPGCDIGRSRIDIRLDHDLLTNLVVAILMIQDHVVLGTLFQDDLIGPAFGFCVRFRICLCVSLGFRK